jgi:hypothetical protein
MKIIEKFQTHDGVEHDSMQQGQRHLDNEFGKRVTALGHKFAPAGVKYSEFTRLIEENLPVFAELIRIKADMAMDKKPLCQFPD